MSRAGSIRNRAAVPVFAALVGGLVLAAPLPAAGAPTAATFSMTVSDATVQVGETVDVTVAVTGAVDLYAYDLSLGYDPDVLEYVDGSAQTAISGQSSATAAGGDLRFVHTKLGTSPSAAGDLTLATLSFEALAAGDVSLGLDVELVGSDAVSVAFADAATADISVPAPAVPVTTPPAPSAPAVPAAPAPAVDDVDDVKPVAGSDRDSLSDTGADVAPWPILGAVAALLLGGSILLLVRRKRAAAK